MKRFHKFEFLPAEWEKLKKDIQQTTTTPDGETITNWKDCAVVELGFLVITPAVMGEAFEIKTPAVLSDKWAVDILFYAEPPASFAKYEVWPESAVHTFAGQEALYMENFYTKFPDKRPTK